MSWRARRRGVFEGPTRALYKRAASRYFDAGAIVVVLNGVAVAGFGVLTLVLYVDLHAGELALVAACLAAVYVVEGLVAGVYLRRGAQPVRSWFEGERGTEATMRAWSAAAGLPLAILRRPSLVALGAAGAAAVDLVVAGLLDLPAYKAAWLFPVSFLLYVSAAILRYLALEL